MQDGTMNWGNNYGRFSNPQFDELTSKAATELDLAKRAGYLHKAEEIAMENFAAIPIYWYVSKNVVSPKVSGFADNVKDIHPVRWLSKTE
jgi:oligopeptide transport system substrate-binding protein